jgi:hypothetical protein
VNFVSGMSGDLLTSFDDAFGCASPYGLAQTPPPPPTRRRSLDESGPDSATSSPESRSPPRTM